MPRRSSGESFHEKKIITMPAVMDNKKNLPAIIHEKPSFLQTIKEGMAFGIGNAIAHRMIGSIPNTISKSGNSIEYEQCMKEHDDKAACERYK